jgi:hypothetical protein
MDTAVENPLQSFKEDAHQKEDSDTSRDYICGREYLQKPLVAGLSAGHVD